jgi:alpha-L-fucosidase
MDEFRRAVSEAVERARNVVDEADVADDWDSLAAHRDPAPEWFRDAKFGLYCHWGIYSVAGWGTEWYPRWLFMTDPDAGEWGGDIYPRHVERYGEPDEFPYHAHVPDFTAADFDPDAWADLYEDAGARFGGLTAEHHDGWANWDSAINPWNAGDRGPGRDLVGEFETALRDRDLRFLASFHHARTKWYFEFARQNFPSVTEDYPERVMYGDVEDDLFHDLWLAELVEVIDEYDPDVLWHDGRLPEIPDAHKRLYLAYYFARATERGRDAVVTAKDRELPVDVAVEDFERGRPAEKQDRPWLTDTSITVHAWGYTDPETVDLDFENIRPARVVVHELIDIVSKNGNLLLNFAPRPDGTVPDDQREVLLAVGEWLDVNGEAIYGTRPWDTFGEGPTRLDEGGHDLDDVEYTARDVRYTQSKDGETLYAVVMGWPETDRLTLDAPTVAGDDGASVRLLGHGETEYEVTDGDRLTLAVPDLDGDERPSDVAVAFALDGFEFD